MKLLNNQRIIVYLQKMKSLKLKHFEMNFSNESKCNMVKCFFRNEGNGGSGKVRE